MVKYYNFFNNIFSEREISSNVVTELEPKVTHAQEIKLIKITSFT